MPEQVVFIDNYPWTVQTVKGMIAKHDKAVCTAVQELAIEAHKDAGATTIDEVDKTYLTSFSDYYRMNNKLTDKQLFRARQFLPKYAHILFNRLVEKHTQTYGELPF